MWYRLVMHELDLREPSHGWPSPLSIWLANPFDDIPGEGLPPQRCWTLARMLAARGHEVVWWTADYSDRRKARRTLPARLEEQESFDMRLVPVRGYARSISLARLRSDRDFGEGFERMAAGEVAAGTLDRPDLIVATVPPLDGGDAASRLARRLDAAVVIDLVDLWPEACERFVPGPTWLRRFLSPLLLGGMLKRREKLLATADGLSSSDHALVEAATGRSDAHVCGLGAYVEEFAVRPATEASGRPIECVFAGPLEAGQDFDALVAAAKLLAQSGTPARLHVAGTGSLEDRLRSAAMAMAPTDTCRLVVHGLLDRAAYRRLLSQCDVGLVIASPSTAAAVPYAACDFAAAGLAIVSCLPGELADAIDRHRAGILYEAGNAASLARAIREFTGNPGRLSENGRGARRLAEAEFSREKIYARFADWLEGVAKSP